MDVVVARRHQVAGDVDAQDVCPELRRRKRRRAVAAPEVENILS